MVQKRRKPREREKPETPVLASVGAKIAATVKPAETLERMQMRESLILAEGKKAEENASWLDRKLYSTWNSIPFAYAPRIFGELLMTVIRQRSLGGQKEPLDLKPAYPAFNFTPLENSFTRRPNGAWNWVKDVVLEFVADIPGEGTYQGGRPYRILSDMGEDGVLLAPKGGDLTDVFPATIIKMMGDPYAMGVLKKERQGQLGEIVTQYSGKYNEPQKMGTDELVKAVKYVGHENAVMFFRQGFRDSQVFMLTRMLGGMIASSKLGKEEKTRLMGWLAKHGERLVLNHKGRGYSDDNFGHPDTGFLGMKYRMRDIGELPGDEEKEIFGKLPKETRDAMNRLFKMREELVQEANETIVPIEYCRNTIYRLSRELGKRLVGVGKLKEASDINFLTVYELDDIIDGSATADDELIKSRREAFGRIKKEAWGE